MYTVMKHINLLERFGVAPYSVLKKLGIPGPKPAAFFGNTAEVFADVSTNYTYIFHSFYINTVYPDLCDRRYNLFIRTLILQDFLTF